MSKKKTSWNDAMSIIYKSLKAMARLDIDRMIKTGNETMSFVINGEKLMMSHPTKEFNHLKDRLERNLIVLRAIRDMIDQLNKEGEEHIRGRKQKVQKPNTKEQEVTFHSIKVEDVRSGETIEDAVSRVFRDIISKSKERPPNDAANE